MGRAREVPRGSRRKIRAAELDRNPRKFEQIIGSSPALESVLEQVEQVALRIPRL